MRDHDYVIGEFIWTGIDYLGESQPFPRRGSSPASLILPAGKSRGSTSAPPTGATIRCCKSSCSPARKPEFPWRAAPAVLHWNWPAGAQLTVRAVANCDEVELFLNGRSLGRHEVSHDVYASDWIVSYAPGVLSAVGFRAGQKVATQ